MSDAVMLVRAAAAWLASVVTVSSVMLLRADSDGPAPARLTLVAAMALLAMMFWPMTAGRRRLPAFAGALVALQVSGHAVLLYATTGHVAHSGASGLFCCPSTPSAGHAGAIATLTANAGWVLLVVQLVLAAALAVPLGLLQRSCLGLAQMLTAVVRTVAPVLGALLSLLGFRAVTPPTPAAPRPPTALRSSGRHAVNDVQRRGPRPRALVRSPLTPFVPRGACA